MKSRVVSLHYTLKNKAGEVLDSSQGGDPLTYLEGMNQIIPGLEKELNNMKKGEQKKVVVTAAEGYGESDARFVVTVERSELPKGDVQVGQNYEIQSDKGSQVVTVTKVTDTQVTLDGNHPLAGQDLYFDVEISDIRDATEEEIKHGHVHGAGGAHHH